MSVINNLKAALYTRLNTDATLTTAATGGVWDSIAPQGTTPPYVVFTKQSGVNMPVLGDGAGFTETLWLVKAVTDEPSAKLAGTICERVDALLDRHALSVSGSSLLVCRRELDVDYPEPVDGRVFRHVGHIYRIGVQ